MKYLVTAYLHGMELRTTFKGFWTAEQLQEEAIKYLEFSAEHEIPLSIDMFCTWLGMIPRSLYAMAEEDPDKKVIIDKVRTIIKSSYIARAERFPTANIFFLKSIYGLFEKTQVEVKDDKNYTPEELAEKLKKLGIEPKE